MLSDAEKQPFDQMNTEMISLMLNGDWDSECTDALFDMEIEEAVGLWAALATQYCATIAGIALARGEQPVETWRKYRLSVTEMLGQ